MPIVVTCRRCGAEHEPGADVARRGDWRLCSACLRADASAKPPAVEKGQMPA